MAILDVVLGILSTLCPQLQAFSDSFCIEKDLQNLAFRKLVEAYTSILIRSDRMDLNFWHYWVFPINPILRGLNRECRVPIIFQPRLFNFQIDAEIRFQLHHFLIESGQSMDRIESEINLFKARPLDQMLKTSVHTFEKFQLRIREERARESSNKLRQITQYIRYFHSSEEKKRLDEYYDLSIRILNCLNDSRSNLAAYDMSVVNIRRQNNRLLSVIASTPHFDFGRSGVISIPQVEISNLVNASFINFDAQLKNGSTKDTLNYDYDLDTVFSSSSRAALRQGMIQACLEETNVKVVSGFLNIICMLLRQVTSRSEFDGDLLGAIQRSWSFEQFRETIEHRKLIGVDDDRLSKDFEIHYPEYQENMRVPAFVQYHVGP